MIESFTQRNSARENDKLDTEEFTRGGQTFHIPKGSVVPVGYISRMAYDVSDNLEYIGFAPPGTATSAAAWQVRKFSYSGGNLVSVLWADGNRNFDNIWDNRASLNYS